MDASEVHDVPAAKVPEELYLGDLYLATKRNRTLSSTPRKHGCVYIRWAARLVHVRKLILFLLQVQPWLYTTIDRGGIHRFYGELRDKLSVNSS